MCNLKKKLTHLFCGLLYIGYSANSIAAAVEIMNPIAQDVSPPFSKIHGDSKQPLVGSSFLLKLNLSDQLNFQNNTLNEAYTADAMLQPEISASLGATITLNRVGIGYGLDNYVSPPGWTPDPYGAVGSTQYVQAADASIAVFKKSDGTLLAVKPIHLLWAGFANAECSSSVSYDSPTVKFDQLAQRWIITRNSFHVTNDGVLSRFTQCIAVSKTKDALGPYYRYAYPSQYFNTLEKLGLRGNSVVNNSSFYMTYMLFSQGANKELKYVGPQLCAFERGKLLVGAKGRRLCKLFPAKTTPPQLVPADFEGTLLPPNASPEFILGTLQGKLLLYRYKATWGTTPTLAAFGTNPVNLQVASFAAPCANGPCIPQKDGGNMLLSWVGDNGGVMKRVVYRHFPAIGAQPAYGAIVANHSIAGPNGKPSAIRWYQFKVPGTFMPTKVHQGTYSPGTSTSFFNGSIAMDKVGNIALGYNASSATSFPYVEITGRTKGDAVNTLRTPMKVTDGLGALQALTPAPIWGASSLMAIDPEDNCTFWYTTEYMQKTGEAYSTKIARFTLPGCKASKFKAHLLVEDYTGAWCGYCPRVAYKLSQLKVRLGSKLVVAANHYSDALQYSRIQELMDTFGVSTFPHARLNRTTQWGETDFEIDSMIASNPYAKLGILIQSSLNGSTLTIKVKAKFLQNYSNLKLGVYVLENGLLLNQRNYADFGYGPDDPLVNFVHDNVLRVALTEPLGDAIPLASTKLGSVYEKTFIYNIPASYNKNKMHIVVFVTDQDNKSLNARESKIGETQTFEEF